MNLETTWCKEVMRDGLSSLARVEELISMIQKLNDSSTSNLGDATRQWPTVASVIAATDHKECLNKFLELNGLSYLKKWLQEALDSYTDDNGIALEELVITLLASFEKLPMDSERINTSGVRATIELLMDHRNIKIKDKAKLLHDRLEHAKKDDVNVHDQGKSGACLFDQSGPAEDLQRSESGPNPSANIPPCSIQSGEEKCEVESAETQLQNSHVIGSLDSTNKEQVLTSDLILSTSLNPVNSNAVLADVNSSGLSLVLNPCQEDLSKCSTGTSLLFCSKEHADDQCDAIGSKNASDCVKEIDMNITEVNPNDSTQKENDNLSSAFVCPPSKAPSLPSAEPMEHQSVDGVVDYGPDKCLITVEESMPAADFTSSFQNHSCNASIPNNTSHSQLSTREEAMSSVVVDLERELNFKSHKNHFSAASDFLKAVGTKANEGAAERSGPGLECLDDALEIARQVAIAVETEVVDYREVSCSSPDVNSRETSGSQGPVSGEQLDEQMTEQVDRNSSTINENSRSLSPEKGSEITQNISSDQDGVSPQPKVPIPESFGNVIGDQCTFDLNANICSDEPECSMKYSPKMPNNVSAPVAVVASTKGTPEVPALHFGGEMGWKGSAATSAFRPASPRRTPDGERTSDPNQKSIFAAIDLNVAERNDEATDVPTLAKQLPASSSLPSGDSCVEVGSKTEVRNLDLNRHGDEDASALPFSSWKLNFQNGERSLSSASSSSYRHSSFRDFDLNDNPSLADTGSHSASQPTTKANESLGWKTADKPVIRIMGAEISLTRKDNTNKAQQFFIPNGMQMEPAMFTRSLLPYPSALTPAYGFGGLPTEPAMSIPSADYSPGNFSYMSETRGMMMHIPQVTGSVLSMSSARPFHYGAANMLPYMTSYGGGRPGFDLNNRMAPPESGREGGSLDHHSFFVQGQRGWMEDPTEPSSSTISLKRKEPDSGWEHTPLNGHNWMSSRP
ncbi:hypothetical protein ZIOFF_053968 [Zingiber officinale]|uniref:TFIIS N-terminal domain-containing protein n=1 Tax=Zingiber officinale TaxID=94328 RepID=A0A8J5FEB0_ZINOF|nr:hypothetical protein ZIOFF_053968 [Zingiber officinale]